jgi:hypothetical protein
MSINKLIWSDIIWIKINGSLNKIIFLYFRNKRVAYIKINSENDELQI